MRACVANCVSWAISLRESVPGSDKRKATARWPCCWSLCYLRGLGDVGRGGGGQLALPLGDDGGGDTVAEDVGGGTGHVEEVVDAQQQQHARLRNVELAQGGGDHHQRGARHAGHG